MIELLGSPLSGGRSPDHLSSGGTMEAQSTDPGSATDATVARLRPRGSRLRAALFAALAFAAGGLTVAAVPLVRSWMNAEPAIYSTVRVEPRKYWLASPVGFAESRDKLAQHQKLQQEIIKSPMVLLPVVASSDLQGIGWLKLQRNPMDWLREHLQIDASEDTHFIRISINGAAPEEQVVLVNEVVSWYLSGYGEFFESGIKHELKDSKAVCAKSREELAAQRKSLIELETKGERAEASALRDEIAVKEDLVKRLLTIVEDLELQVAYPPRAEMLHRAKLPKPK